MPLSPASPPKTTLPLRKLWLLSVAVVLAHLALLGGVPVGLSWQADGADAPSIQASLLTRMPTQQPARPAAAPQEPSRKQTAPPPQAPTTPPNAVAAPEGDALAPQEAPLTPQPAGPDAAQTGDESHALATPTKAPEPPAPPVPSALAPSTAAAAAAEVHQARTVAFAEPMLLLYDGRGEEKGYIKYAASGELLWKPNAMQYQARLELSTFGFRVRTWTSKGELTDGGLQPTRFGDKPRGAERATHFQRDKGIISFSANNPDVPLQPGAQDKLSAILQLSALLAGEPAHYPAGTAIRFQAADAHRAEVWTFTVGAAEEQDLPGGTLSTRKLTKEPTVEFDQRIEVWLAPSLQHLPVRLRITEANGAFADLTWRKIQKPE